MAFTQKFLQALWPFCTLLARFAAWHWYAPVVALIIVLPLFVLATAVSLVCEVGLKLVLSAPVLRNVHAFISLISVAALYLAMSFGMPTSASFIQNWARHWPQWTAWSPAGLATRLLLNRDGIDFVKLTAMYVGETAAIVWTFMGILAFAVRQGFDRGGHLESGRRKPVPLAARPASASLQLPFSALQRRELLLLARDRNFMIQTMVMPVVAIVAQFVFSGGTANLHKLLSGGYFLTTAAFTIGAYMLMMSAFQALNHEGGALWMLYTFPHSLETLLREKTRMWGTIAVLYPVIVLALGFRYVTTVDYQFAVSCLTAIVGIPIFASIAVTLGVIASDPTAVHQQTRIRPSWLYLYMLLAGLYGYAVHSEEAIQKLVMLVLTTGLAVALWQKVRDQLPYLLDPVDAAPAQVSAADGLMSAMLFFILQGILYHFVHDVDDPSFNADILLTYGIAGLVTFILVRYTYWRSKTTGVPKLAIFPLGRTLSYGIAGGGLAAIVGVAWLHILMHFDFLSSVSDGARSHLPVLLGLAVFAAPLCEEFIFRGLIFAGFCRVMSVSRAALLSAALFAVVHPVASMLPVFALGLVTAFVYARTKSLAASMLVHAIYNGIVVMYQLTL